MQVAFILESRSVIDHLVSFDGRFCAICKSSLGWKRGICGYHQEALRRLRCMAAFDIPLGPVDLDPDAASGQGAETAPFGSYLAWFNNASAEAISAG
ncbi:hypothetical protein ASG50_17755 [Rhizobium sp. Leaf386]|nr:hypothetical protein ASG50_17755 [Rhizobium sp. Leaf386]